MQQPGLFGGKPPIVQPIFGDRPLPVIPVHRGAEKKLHPASESAHQVALPVVIKPISPDYYQSVADEFLLRRPLNDLNGVGFAVPDPSILVHRNESDAGRSIDLSINREVAMILVHGHQRGTFTMDSTTQARSSTVFDPRLPHEPEEIIRIPDWVAKCQWDSPDKGRIDSTLVLEYKDRELVPVDEFLEELGRENQRLIELAIALEQEAPQLDAFILADQHDAAPNFQGHLNLNRGLDQYGAPVSRYTVGLKRPVAFTRNVEMILRQSTTYAVGEGTTHVAVIDYDSLIVLKYPHLDKNKDEVTRFREGPGDFVEAFVLKNQSHKIRKNTLGARLRSIRGE